MAMYLWLKALHILMVVVWLGTDIGTFASFHRVLDVRLSVPTRLSMSRLSNLLDQGPRSALVILLMLGLTMTHQGGWGLTGESGSAIAFAASIIGVVWFAGVWHQYWVNHPPSGVTRSSSHLKATAVFRVVDLWWRIGVAGALFVVATMSLAANGGGAIAANWLSWKLILFAGIVADGVLIRVLLPKLGDSIAAIATKGSSVEREAELARHGRTAKIYVLMIWMALVVMSGLAVMKPSLDVTFYGLVKTVHVLSIATWFGVDLGVFVAAKLCLDAKLSAESRAQFTKLFGQLDLGPRVSLLATVPLGLTLAHLRWGLLEGRRGVGVAAMVLAVVTVGWIFGVIRQHQSSTERGDVFTKVDLAMRVVLVVAMAVVGASLWPEHRWLGAKSILFAVMVSAGLWIRYGLRDFGAAFASTQIDSPEPASIAHAQKIIRSVYLPVLLIWGLLIANIVLASVKPT